MSLRLTRGKSSMQRSGAILHDDDTGPVTMVLRIPPGSGVTFGGHQTEISTTKTLVKGGLHTLLLDWQLVAQSGRRPPHVVLEVDLQSLDEAPNTGTVPIELTYTSVSMGMLLVGAAAFALGAMLIGARRRRRGESHRESSALESVPRTDRSGSSEEPEYGRDRSTLTYR